LLLEDGDRELGSGLSSTLASLRLRYEVTRKFAPYVGVELSNTYRGTADFARAAGERTRDARLAADVPHSSLVHGVVEAGRERAIARRIGDITPPRDLADPERVRRGAGNYAAMCADCHLTPGVANAEIRLGLHPTPPDLTLTRAAVAGQSAETAAARQFWIIKHGIKASGMPAGSKAGMDDASFWI
jgi:hypothetical protein